jgi:uncharacterized protein (UPF0303 family)
VRVLTDRPPAVRVYSVSSYAIGRKLLGQGKTLDDLGPDHAPHGGAVPIFVRVSDAERCATCALPDVRCATVGRRTSR